MKLQVKTNIGLFGAKYPEHEAKAYHKGYNKIEDYSSSSKINARMQQAASFGERFANLVSGFNVKNFFNSQDIDGITIVKWSEHPTNWTIALTIAAEIAIIIGLYWYTPFLIAPLCVAATLETIRAFAFRKREYVGNFNTSTKELVSEDEADKIRDLNKNEIKALLNEISDLLDDRKENKFDLDKGKEELKKLEQKHGDHLSNINSKKFKDLIEKHDQKKVEYTDLLTKQSIKKMEEIGDIAQIMDQAFERAREDRDNKHDQTQQQIYLLIDNIVASRDVASVKFEEAMQERQQFEQEVGGNLEDLSEQMQARFDEIENRLDQAQSERLAIFNQTEEMFNQELQDILTNREESKRRFDDARADRESQFNLYVAQFAQVKVNQEALINSYANEFERAKQERSDLFDSIVSETKRAQNSLLEVKSNMMASFKEADIQRQESFARNNKGLLNLRGEQAENFASAMSERQSQSDEINSTILSLRDQVDDAFATSLVERLDIYSRTQTSINTVEKEIANSRVSVEGMLESASLERFEIYSKSQERLKEVENQVLESRRLADARFDQAVAQRLDMHKNLSDSLQQNREELTQNRQEMQQAFEEAKAHMDKIYAKTQERLQAVNDDVSRVRSESDANFATATEHRNAIYEQTATKLDAINENVNQVRSVCEENFTAAMLQRDELYEQTAEQIDKVSAQTMGMDSACVQILQDLYANASKQRLQIEQGNHHKIVGIKDMKSTGMIGLSKSNILNRQIKEKYQEFVACDNIEEKSEYINAAIEFAVSSASREGRNYDFARDKFQVKTLLMYQLKFFLDQNIEQIFASMGENEQDVIKAYKAVQKMSESMASNDDIDSVNYQELLSDVENRVIELQVENGSLNAQTVELVGNITDLQSKYDEIQEDMVSILEVLEMGIDEDMGFVNNDQTELMGTEYSTHVES